MEYVTWKLETLKTNIDDFENDVTQLNDTGLNRFGNSFTPFNLITLKE